MAHRHAAQLRRAPELTQRHPTVELHLDSAPQDSSEPVPKQSGDDQFAPFFAKDLESEWMSGSQRKQTVGVAEEFPNCFPGPRSF